MRVALATCKVRTEPDPDEGLVMAALERAGIEARLLAWDDDDAPFAAQDLVILRSTWNYHERVDDFLAWCTRTAERTRLLNPPNVVAWNAKKTYLADLEKRGVAAVPTAFVSQGSARRLDDIVAERGWDAIVIKPVVSAGSFRTERFSRASAEAGERFLRALVADRDAMVQSWMPSVETYGERSLMWIDGTITHAIRKSPRFSGGVEQVSDEVAIADDERAFAERAVAPLASELLYARIDMIRDDEGAVRIMELELIEPSLFFQQSLGAPASAGRENALERFVGAVARRR